MLNRTFILTGCREVFVCIQYDTVAAAGLSKRGRSFLANIIKIYHLFIPKFCPTFLFKKIF